MIASANVRIRPATLDDLNTLHDFETAYFGLDQFTRQQVRYLLVRANATTLVLEFNNKVVGAATMVWRKKSSTGRLYSIVIDRGAQGHGFAAQLLRACEDEARRRGCRRVSLEVRVDNAAAVGLYDRHGYTIIETLEHYYTDGTDGYRMVKTLPPHESQ